MHKSHLGYRSKKVGCVCRVSMRPAYNFIYSGYIPVYGTFEELLTKKMCHSQGKVTYMFNKMCL